MHKDIEKILYTNDDIQKRCQELGKRLTKDYQGRNPILIGLLKGSIPFMAELIKHIDCPIEIDFMDVHSYEGTKSTGVVRVIKDTSLSLLGRDLIFVEDIVDTGLTISVVVHQMKDRGAKSIEIVSLLDKKEGREVKGVEPKYIGFDIPKEFVVGFGLDYNEAYRQLPYVGILKPSVYRK